MFSKFATLVVRVSLQFIMPLRNTSPSAPAIRTYMSSLHIFPFYIYTLVFACVTILTQRTTFTSGLASASSTSPTPNSPAFPKTHPLVFAIAPNQFFPNPSALPSSTHATLQSHSFIHSAPLSRANSFLFAGIAQGSYLLQIHARDYAFEPLRVDVRMDGIGGKEGENEEGRDAAANGDGEGDKENNNKYNKKKAELMAKKGLQKVTVWRTFPGHPWDNKGELMGEGWISGEMDTWTVGVMSTAGNNAQNEGNDGSGNGVVILVQPKATLNYYQARNECRSLLKHYRLHSQGRTNANIAMNLVSVLSILKNPMILLVLFSLLLMVGVPYLVDNSKFSLFPNSENYELGWGFANTFEQWTQRPKKSFRRCKLRRKAHSLLTVQLQTSCKILTLHLGWQEDQTKQQHRRNKLQKKWKYAIVHIYVFRIEFECNKTIT